MNTKHFLPVALTTTFLLGATSPTPLSADNNWPAWRGPNGDGTVEATNLPVEWGPERNIVWKTAMPGWSGASPVVWEDRVFITSPSATEPTGGVEPTAAAANEGGGERGEGRQRRGGFGANRDPGGQQLMLLCLNRTDGAILWQKVVDEGNRTWRKHNNTSPSPVTDGTHVWVVTGNGVITAFTMTGDEVWKRNLQELYYPFGLNWGYASSPLLHEDRLIIEVLHGNDTDDPSYVISFDKTSGEVQWRVERPTDAVRESPDAYTTPALLEVGGAKQIVISGGDYVTGHALETGKELWRAAGLNPRRAANYRIIASPVVHDEMIYAPTRNRPLLALKAGGSGDVSESHLAWKYEAAGAPDVPTPVTDGTYFYMVDDSGMVTCLNAKTGEVIWGPERTATGTVSSSPVLADGKIYFTNERSQTVVLKAGPEFELLATNELDGTYTLSSMAVAGNQLFIRTSDHLYCIGEE